MGEVYRAHDTRLGRDVAIKVLPRGLAADPDALARFEREARAIAAINHPNILALHDIGTADGIAHAVMELLEGETLRKRLDSGPVPPRKALEWAGQLARGLAAAHDRGIVHRDLKPENVFLTHDGRLKILDFGVARRHELAPDVDSNLTTVTQPGVFIGTPAYASPEQVLGEPATPRSDLFAFGVVLYELLTGTNPFRRETMAETMTAILRADPPPLAGAVQGVPPAALRVLDHCLEKQPSERPSSARDIAMFLDASGNTSVEMAPVSVADAERPSRRAQLKMLAAACGLLLAVVAATWGYVYAMSERTVNAALAKDLERAQGLVTRVHEWRLERLQLTARLLASFPELKALFETTDAATIRDFLVTYQQRNPGHAPARGARTVRNVARPDRRVGNSRDLRRRLADRPGRAARRADGRVRRRPFVSRRGRGCRSRRQAVRLHRRGGASRSGVRARDQRRDRRRDRPLVERIGAGLHVYRRTGAVDVARAMARSRAVAPTGAAMVDVGARRFAAREVPLTADPPVSAIVARSRDDALEPFRSVQNGLVVIGLLIVASALVAGLWLSKARSNQT